MWISSIWIKQSIKQIRGIRNKLHYIKQKRKLWNCRGRNIDKRVELQEGCIAYVKYLDFLFNLCYDKQIINGKKYLKFGEKLDTIVRYIIAWRNASKPEKAKSEVLP